MVYLMCTLNFLESHSKKWKFYHFWKRKTEFSIKDEILFFIVRFYTTKKIYKILINICLDNINGIFVYSKYWEYKLVRSISLKIAPAVVNGS